MAGLVGPGRAEHLLSLDLTVLLAFLEAVVCESEDNAKHIQDIYDRHKPRPLVTPEQRRADVAAFLSLADG